MTNDEALPAQLPGLDLAEALARIEIPVKVFKNILLKFAEKNRGKAQEMVALASKGDQQRLSVMAHTLKGAAANIGATTLPQACLAVERAVEEERGLEEIQGLINELALALDVVITSLGSLR